MYELVKQCYCIRAFNIIVHYAITRQKKEKEMILVACHTRASRKKDRQSRSALSVQARAWLIRRDNPRTDTYTEVILIIRFKRQRRRPLLEESLDHLSLRYRFQFILIARAISSRARNMQTAYKTGPKIQSTLYCVARRRSP